MTDLSEILDALEDALEGAEEDGLVTIDEITPEYRAAKRKLRKKLFGKKGLFAEMESVGLEIDPPEARAYRHMIGILRLVLGA